MGMPSSRSGSFCALVFLAGLPCCISGNEAIDLATNSQLYVDVPFTTRVPGDRVAFVAPLADRRAERTTPLPTADRGFPITYGDDGAWERPVAVMVDEVLRRQLQDSGLFATLAEVARPDALVVVPSLELFLVGAAESISGGRSFAEVVLRVQVYGPSEGQAGRALWLDRVFPGVQRTPVSFQPINAYRLAGPALAASITGLLQGLDGSNIARSGVPMAVAVPASAERSPR